MAWSLANVVVMHRSKTRPKLKADVIACIEMHSAGKLR